jgi:zinc protease
MRFASALVLPLFAAAPAVLLAAEPAASVDIQVPDIDFTTQTLDNGLRVVYAPMDNAPVVHVRVLYHVGSKDEQPDRQGFAHLFEHMMFHGSEHVAHEEHMKRINGVGGSSNAFTSFDQTTYVNTVPSNALEMALYLEADRMASFKVSADTFATERSVVNEEYLLRVVNPPYGRQSMDFFELAFDKSHYQWTPIGNMEQLAESQPAELQEFFDTFYVPNNAVLAIAGDFDVEEAKQWVESYYGWIPAGGEVPRPSPEEPEQTERRERTVYAERAPLASLVLAFKAGGWGSEDVVALEVLGNILGTGRSSRMYQALVAGQGETPPLAQQASAGMFRLEDAGLMFASIFVLPGQDPKAVESAAMDVLREVAANGVTDEELDKAKTQMKLALLRGQQTAESVASSVAEAWAFGDDPNLANEQAKKIEAVTSEDLARVAEQYLDDSKVAVLTYLPGKDPTGGEAEVPQEAADGEGAAEKPQEDTAADGEAATQQVEFPEEYPEQAPVPDEVVRADFETGESFEVDGVDVVLIRDTRLPLVGLSMIFEGFGGDALPDEQVGLAGIATDLMTRGAAGRSATEQSELLESVGISLNASDGGDHMRVSASFPKDVASQAAGYVQELLVSPNLDEREFLNLRNRFAAQMQQSLADPTTVARQELDKNVFGASNPAGRTPSLPTIMGLGLEDVRRFLGMAFNRDEATVIVAGDMTKDEATSFVRDALQGVGATEAEIEADTYVMPEYAPQILLVDNPGGGQAAVRMGNRSFTVQSDEKYASSVANQILSGGIESRINQALRADKGLTYGAGASFRPSRNSGAFSVGFATKPETTAEALRTAFGVLERMAKEPVTDAELADGKRRVAGSMVLSQQTVGQLANLRSNILLNDYDLDYYNKYADRIAEVTADDVQKVVATYGMPEQLSIVVVAPADVVEEQLAEFGEVSIVPMPLARGPAGD